MPEKQYMEKNMWKKLTTPDDWRGGHRVVWHDNHTDHRQLGASPHSMESSVRNGRSGMLVLKLNSPIPGWR
jgi:hypothetical protein